MNAVEKYYQVLEVLQELEKFSIYEFGSDDSILSKKSYNGIDLEFLKQQVFEKKISSFKITSNFANTIYADQMIAYVHNWLLTNAIEKNAKVPNPAEEFIIYKIRTKNDNGI